MILSAIGLSFFSLAFIFQFDQIVILNAFGKRLDQTMANIESLFHVAKLTNKPVYSMSEDSMACLLLPVGKVSMLFCN